MLVAVAAGGVFLAVASAEVGNPGVYELNHHHPVAGHVFTALVVLDAPGMDAIGVIACPEATVNGHQLTALQAAFSGSVGRNALVCSYRIPRDATGRLSVHVSRVPWSWMIWGRRA